MLPKKSFSQNFLRDEEVVENIARLGEADHFNWVVEIGAGEGALTAELSRKARRVVALEVDRDLVPGLLKRFPIASNVSVAEGDILRADIFKLLETRGFRSGESWAIFGNIPYAITGKIIRKITLLETIPGAVVLMVQKEVALRIVAEKGKQSILSVAVALFGKAEILFSVSKTAFFPEPNVESAVIRIVPHHDMISREERERVLRFVKIGFASKRKTLANNLVSGLRLEKESVEKMLLTLGKDVRVRAEELSPDEWVRLVCLLSPAEFLKISEEAGGA